MKLPITYTSWLGTSSPMRSYIVIRLVVKKCHIHVMYGAVIHPDSHPGFFCLFVCFILCVCVFVPFFWQNQRQFHRANIKLPMFCTCSFCTHPPLKLLSQRNQQFIAEKALIYFTTSIHTDRKHNIMSSISKSILVRNRKGGGIRREETMIHHANDRSFGRTKIIGKPQC